MKRLISSAAVLGLVIGTALAQEPKAATKGTGAADAGLQTAKQKASYAFGLDIGRRLKNQGLEVDLDLFIRGFRDSHGGKAALTDEQMQEAVQTFRTEGARSAADKN